MGERGGAPRLQQYAQHARTAIVSDLFMAHHRRLVGLAALLVDDHESAEEVVQDAFMGLYRRWWLLRDPSGAVSYLNRSVVNRARDRLRRRRRYAVLAPRLREPEQAVDSAERAALGREESDRVWSAIRELPRRQREVVVLRYYLDQSEAEIAATLGVSPGAVKTHASRGLAALARRLGGPS